ncbi:branched-chain amino acid ABC transporter permease [Thalassobaculum sp.]|uniref:branched-chain amino acid ABC transporter permease n=1 Tax=Thalassobaculum sp. TaxID=2022740 RepID=UPI0032EEE079
MIEAAAQLAVNAVALGAVYALVALGFVLVIGAVGAVNFAHGELVMLGGMVAVGVAALLPADLPVPGLVALPAVLAIMAVAGLFVAGVAYAPLRRAPPTSVFIATIALGLIIQHGVNAGIGPEPLLGPPVVDTGIWQIAGIGLARQQLATIATALGLIVGVHVLLQRTRFGRRLRAAAQDAEMARAIGIRVNVTVAVSFALAAALAGAAGLLLSNQYLVTPTDGAMLMLKAYIATVIGGWGRIWGAALGAFAIAVFETLVAAWTSYLVAEALLYVGVLAVLAFRPKGLFGEVEGRRA